MKRIEKEEWLVLGLLIFGASIAGTGILGGCLFVWSLIFGIPS